MVVACGARLLDETWKTGHVSIVPRLLPASAAREASSRFYEARSGGCAGCECKTMSQVPCVAPCESCILLMVGVRIDRSASLAAVSQV
jgi:hypothetical protein